MILLFNMVVMFLITTYVVKRMLREADNRR